MMDVIEKARQVVGKVGELPPIPAVILESMKLLNDPSTTVRKIQEQVMLDQALTAFILKVANSALYGLRKEVSTISYAINLMGYNNTRSLLTAYLSNKLYGSKGSKLVQTVLWKHAIASAVYGKTLAVHLGKVNSEEAFIAALLHDIGKGILLKNNPDQMEDIIRDICTGGKVSVDAERAVLGFTHVEVGYLLMKNWRFSENIIETLVNHHNCKAYSGKNPLVPIVSLANKLSHQGGYAFDPGTDDLFEAEILGISGAQLEGLKGGARREIEKYLEIF